MGREILQPKYRHCIIRVSVLLTVCVCCVVLMPFYWIYYFHMFIFLLLCMFCSVYSVFTYQLAFFSYPD